jgi:hypothetical protein
LLADEQLFGNFLVTKALGNVLNDLLLAVTEQRFAALRFGLIGGREGFHDFGSHMVIQPDFSSVNAVNALDKEVRGRLFQNDSASAKTHSADDITVIFGGGQYNDPGGDGVEIDLLEDGEAIFNRHTEIKEEHVGFEFSEELYAFLTILRFANDGNTLVRTQKFPQAIAEDSVVIRN